MTGVTWVFFMSPMYGIEHGNDVFRRALWQVDDAATSILMKEFYRNLKTMDAVAALHTTLLWGRFRAYGSMAVVPKRVRLTYLADESLVPPTPPYPNTSPSFVSSMFAVNGFSSNGTP